MSSPRRTTAGCELAAGEHGAHGRATTAKREIDPEPGTTPLHTPLERPLRRPNILPPHFLLWLSVSIGIFAPPARRLLENEVWQNPCFLLSQHTKFGRTRRNWAEPESGHARPDLAQTGAMLPESGQIRSGLPALNPGQDTCPSSANLVWRGVRRNWPRIGRVGASSLFGPRSGRGHLAQDIATRLQTVSAQICAGSAP